MAFGDPLSLPIPAVGTPGPAYASQVNALLAELRDRVSQKLPVGSIAAATGGEVLDMANRPVLGASELGLYEQAVAPTGAPFGRLVRYAGNLYYVDAFGAVQVTQGATLNVAGVGGIGGDYGTAGAEATYESAGNVYHFYQDVAAGTYARLRALRLELHDPASVSQVSLAAPANPTTPYVLTLPTSVPGSGVSLLGVNSTGQLVHAAAVSNGPTFAGDVTLDGATKIRHGSRVVNFAPHLMGATSGLVVYSGFRVTNGGVAGVSVNLGLAVQAGWRITAVAVKIQKGGTQQANFTLRNGAIDGTTTTLGAWNTTSSGSVTASHTLGTPHTVAAGDLLHLLWSYPGTANTDFLAGISVTYDVV
jgi:hypothetical protein